MGTSRRNATWAGSAATTNNNSNISSTYRSGGSLVTGSNVTVTAQGGTYYFDSITLGAAGRAFGFEQDLWDGYFDPDLYWIGEALGRFGREWRKWGITAEVAPGVQQVGEDGERSATIRTTGGITYIVAPGRSFGLSGAYANAGLQRLSPTDTGGGYRYYAVSVSGSWVF